MKNIEQFVTEGIKDRAELIAALDTAMRLEFSTLPPYLCAQWSIDKDPDDVASIIEGIAVQEMYHLALAGNILSAIGSVPRVAYPGFLVTYPTNKLPGDIAQKLAVDLTPLTLAQLDVFMQIENPQFNPVVIQPPERALAEAVKAPATIGDFYDTVIEALKRLNPKFDPNAKFIRSGEAVQIKSIDDAIQAIVRIKDEGEGTPDSPGQGPSDPNTLAHFYQFQMIKTGQRYVLKNGKWVIDTASRIRFPTVFDFGKTGKSGPSSLAFSQILTDLLKSLEDCWRTGAKVDVPLMRKLRDSGTMLIRTGVRPEFTWSI
jgi:hypothetical protein